MQQRKRAESKKDRRTGNMMEKPLTLDWVFQVCYVVAAIIVGGNNRRPSLRDNGLMTRSSLSHGFAFSPNCSCVTMRHDADWLIALLLAILCNSAFTYVDERSVFIGCYIFRLQQHMDLTVLFREGFFVAHGQLQHCVVKQPSNSEAWGWSGSLKNVI